MANKPMKPIKQVTRVQDDPQKLQNQLVYPEITAATAYSGPIPDAAQLERYEKICPGAADRILKMAEKQSDHRQSLEKALVRSSVINSRLGVIMAFILCIALASGGIYVVMHGHDWPGTLIGASGVVGLAGTFIYGTSISSRSNSNDVKKEN